MGRFSHLLEMLCKIGAAPQSSGAAAVVLATTGSGNFLALCITC